MEILQDNLIELKNVSLILGFFDGIHAGHREVISSGVDFAHRNNSKSVLLTFKESPAIYFGSKFEYIYPRSLSYELISDLGVDYIIESDFETLAQVSADAYLKSLIDLYNPISISTGFNHTFGLNREGTPDFLKKYEEKYLYKYLCIPSTVINGKMAGSTLIKSLLEHGEIELANKILAEPFKLESEVVHGSQLGRKLGFPTANMFYPKNIVRLPYGVYAVRVLGHAGVLNWGVKPSIGNKQEVLEVHIPNFEMDLYGRTLRIDILKKLRDEKKFSGLEELKKQIAEDIKECLK